MFRKFVSFVAVAAGMALIVLMVSNMMGCSVGVSGSIGAQAFYPDSDSKTGNPVGDPRKGRYSTGNTSDGEHFQGMGGGR
jgi:hypothetical protein